ncbi:nuclear transport factor 2 family protein [Paenibacillus rhizoplanae]
MSTAFSKDALVLDEGKEWAGKAAIKQWSAEYHFGANITLEPIQDKQHGEENVVVFLRLTGISTKPASRTLSIWILIFQIRNDKIKQLAIGLSKGSD